MKRLFLIPLPTIIIGSIAMYRNDISIIIWGQNIVGLILVMLLSYLVSRNSNIIDNTFTIPISILLLLLTYLDSGLGQAHVDGALVFQTGKDGYKFFFLQAVNKEKKQKKRFSLG